MTNSILKCIDMHLYYATRKGPVKAVDNVSFNLDKGESLALVGESGCGKSSLAKALVRLLPRNIHIYEGEVFLGGQDVMKLSDREFRREIRWKKMAMVFQGAMNALNPVLKVGYQVAEPLLIHERANKHDAMNS